MENGGENWMSKYVSFFGIKQELMKREDNSIINDTSSSDSEEIEAIAESAK